MKRILSIMLWIFLPAGMALAQQTFYFPQIADGRDPSAATHWHTTVFLSNQSAATASGTVTLYQSSGSAMNISFVDENNAPAAVGNQISFQIPPGQTRKYTSVASGALLVGYFEDDDFVFAGKIGTGFDTKLLLELRRKLDALEIPTAPFTRAIGLPRLRAHWVRPEIVVQAAFIEWTVHGKLRHPRFLGVRGDKAAREVVKET